MSEWNSTTSNDVQDGVTTRRLFGRRVILTDATEITRENVLDEIVNKAHITHLINKDEIEYLWNYYKGDQPILYRQKEVRPEVNFHIVENRAQEIVAFKTGYLCGSPIQYVSRSAENNVSESVKALNDMMLSDGKASKDKELIEWDMICGTAFRMILPDDESAKDEAPFEIYTLDPRCAYVVYRIGHKRQPLAGVYEVYDEENKLSRYTVYTKDTVFEIEEDKIVKETPHVWGQIPIIEYPANPARMGAFEPVIPLLDAINVVDSDRLNGLSQFIQSLVVLTNAELPEGMTANSIRENGLIELKSTTDNKATIDIISENLDQTNTQTLKQDLYQAVLNIVGMPSQSNGFQSDSSNNGAVILRNGWQGAEARAKDSELMFKQSEQEFLKIVIFLCRELRDVNLHVSDIEAHFTRRQYEDILTKSQVLVNMLSNDKIAPKLAFEASGLFIDSEEAYRESKEYYDKLKAEEERRAKEAIATKTEEEIDANTDATSVRYNQQTPPNAGGEPNNQRGRQAEVQRRG